MSLDRLTTDHELGVDEQLALLSHELLNPLVVAQGFAGLAVEQATGDPVMEELLQPLRRHVDLAILLLQRLRDGRLDAGELVLDEAPLDLAELVRRTVTDMAATIAADHPVEFVAPDGPVRIVGDAVRLQQVLFNLLNNGAKYSDAGDPIIVTLRAGDHAAIQVRNHGFGVAPDDAERLFERGSRGEANGKQGLGIGLFVSRRIAEAHGGSLHVEPAEITGSVFVLRLPLAD